jgi:uncharacterized protein (DUF433 family)
MNRSAWQDRVVMDPEIHHGEPCIKGTRIAVSTLLGSLADGMSVTDLISAYPQLHEEDVAAALEYAADNDGPGGPG